LTGSTGMLGTHVYRRLLMNADLEILTIGRTRPAGDRNFYECDLTDIAAFSKIIDETKPECVIHCAANVNVNGCETDRDRTYRLHVETCAVLASRAFIKRNVFISTDSVFDGTKGNYVPTDTKNPLNYYALTKSMGEDKLLEAKNTALIIRTNIFGYRLPFQKSLFEWAYRSLKNGDKTPGFGNVRFNPLYVGTLAKLIAGTALSPSMQPGVYHFGCTDNISKFDFIHGLASAFNLDNSLIVKTTAANEIGGVRRPMDTTLETASSAKLAGISLPSFSQEMKSLSNDLSHEKSLQDR
jgi:dTDP-4-dehydrorhamnose reductase